MTRPAALATRLVDAARAQVTRFDLAPGAATGWHVRGPNQVIAMVTDRSILLEEPGGGARAVTVPAGAGYRRGAGVEHNVVDAGAEPMSFAEAEQKQEAAR